MGIHTLVAALAFVVGLQAPPQTQDPVVYEPGQSGVTNPVLIRKVEPKYTAEARRARITGEVWLDVSVQSDGTVKVLGIKKSLDKTFGLDEAAVEAAKAWLFQPAKKDGKPVPTRVALVMEFKLSSDAPQDDVYKPGPSVKAPVLKSKVDPTYTREAMQAKIQGEVWIDAVVETDGTIKIARIQKSLDDKLGLDEAAIAAAKKWKFEPGVREGKPVRVSVTLMMEFRLH
jgi:TonB family protein